MSNFQWTLNQLNVPSTVTITLAENWSSGRGCSPQGSRLQPRQAVGTLHLALTAVDGADTTTVPTIDDRLHPRL